MGDMICTLPMLHALRAAYPHGHLAVACDQPGSDIAAACPAVNQTILLKKGFCRFHTRWLNRKALRGFDMVIAVKGGFDAHLAATARLTNAPVRIGFASNREEERCYYTHPVPPPSKELHQVDVCLQLLRAIGIDRPAIRFDLVLPPDVDNFKNEIAQRFAIMNGKRIGILNLSSNRPENWMMETHLKLIRNISLSAPAFFILTASPEDKLKACTLMGLAPDNTCEWVETPTPLHLLALFQFADFAITPEGGAAHLASICNLPSLVLWWHGPFHKWKTLSPMHRFLDHRLTPGGITHGTIEDAFSEELLPLLKK